MRRGILILFATILQSTCIVHAQKVYTYVQQDNVKIDKLGTAAFSLSEKPSVEFVDGKAVMTIGDNTVAILPMSDKGQLVMDVDFTSMEDAELNKVVKEFKNPYATLFSPFQLSVPEETESDVKVYAPIYDETNHVLICNSGTQMKPGSVLPVETALLLKDAGTIVLGISGSAPTLSPMSALTGSSLKINVPSISDDYTLCTLGHAKEDVTQYGFFRFTGTNLNPGLAWFVTPKLPAETKYVTFSFDEGTTPAISANENALSAKNFKYIKNGRIIILNNNVRPFETNISSRKKYNLNGLEIK